ncbi:MAG: ATP-binding protein [Planctomycetota bacterium]
MTRSGEGVTDERAMEAQIRELSLLYELSCCLGQSLDLEADLDSFVERLARALRMDAVVVFGRVAAQSTGDLLAAIGVPRRRRATLALPESVVTRLNQSPKPARWSCSPEAAPADEPVLLFRDALNPRLRSLYGIAARVGDRLVGALVLGTVRTEPMAASTERMLRMLAARVAVTIDHGMAHAAMRASEEKYRRLLLGAADAIVVYDVEQRALVDFNTAAEQLLRGYVNDHVRQLVEFFDEAAKTPERAQRELVVPGPRGEERAFEASLQTFEIDGAPRLLAVFRDVTARNRMARQLVAAREQALAASRAKSSFLAAMSHEIRTPMNGVLGMAEMLIDMGPPDLSQEARPLAQTIHTSAGTLLGILNDILDIAKIESGRMTLESVPFALAVAVSDAVALHSETAVRQGLEITLDCDPSLPELVVGDALRVQQIVGNLVQNAIKFTERGGVSVHLRPTTKSATTQAVLLEVRDTGIGMEPDVVGRLFSPFSQGDGSISRRFGGTGLGLSICKQLAQMMGGSIRVSSTPGSGSSFVVELPMPIAQRRPAPAPAAELPLSLDGAAVLLAEDNAINQQVAVRMLSKLGAVTTTAESGREALERLAVECYDLVLMDCEMPVLDGYEATRELRRREDEQGQARTPVIGFSANVMQEDQLRCIEVGMDGFIAKPVRFSMFCRVIRSVLTERGVGAVSPESTVPLHP